MEQPKVMTVSKSPLQTRFCVECIICGNAIELTENESLAVYHGKAAFIKVCDDCKSAITFAKSQREHEKYGGE